MTFPVERLRQHLDAAAILPGYTVRYDRWTDADMQSEDRFVVYRLAGSGGDSAFDIQQPDVRTVLVGRPAEALQLRQSAWGIVEYLRYHYDSGDVWLFDPVGFPQGPFDMTDGRLVWEVVVRVGVTDH